MAESFVQVPPDSFGKKLRSITHDLGDGAVHTHTVVLVDATTGAAISTLAVAGTVALDAPTLAALESVVVSGTVALDPATLAALESVTATILGTVAVTGPLTDTELRASPLPLPTGAATNAALVEIRDYLDTVETKLQSLLDRDAGLTARMFARQPSPGFRIWLDVANASYIYIAEAPLGDAPTAATFDGVRVPKDANGNPLGKVEENSNFVWNDRTTTGGWS